MAETLPVALTDAELDALLRAARESSPRDLALVTVMVYGGLRVSEAVTLQWRDVTADHIEIRCGKGGKQRLVDTHERVIRALEGLVGVHKSTVLLGHSTEYIFAGRFGGHFTRFGAHELMVRLSAEAGVPAHKAHCHALRHTFAVRLLKVGINLITIRDLLGHSSVSVTEIYLRLVSEHRRAAIDALS